MKILHLCISNFFMDSFSYQENLLTKYHAKMGHEVTVIASLEVIGKNGKFTYLDKTEEYVNEDGVRIIRIGYKGPIIKIGKILRHYDRLYQAIERVAPDIIFTHNIASVDMHQIVRYARRHSDVRLYADNHEDYINSQGNRIVKYLWQPFLWRPFAKELEPYLTKCYGVTPMRCRFLQEVYHINPDIIEFLPMGIDDEAIPADRTLTRQHVREELGIRPDQFLIITGGKIDKLKNTDILLQALRILSDDKVALVICGKIMPEMEALTGIIDSSPNVRYLGWCNAERVMQCMAAADMACFPGTHSTLWEQAVGMGLPAIFKRWPEMEHVNVNGNSLFVKGEDAQELADVIKSMVFTDQYNRISKLAEEASASFRYSDIAKKAVGL